MNWLIWGILLLAQMHICSGIKQSIDSFLLALEQRRRIIQSPETLEKTCYDEPQCKVHIRQDKEWVSFCEHLPSRRSNRWWKVECLRKTAYLPMVAIHLKS